MIRVTNKGNGAVIIITNGVPQKRLKDLQAFAAEKNYTIEIEYERIELSKLSQMINIMRTSLGNKPLSHAIKKPEIIKATLEEMMRLEAIKKEETLYNDPKTKIFGLLLKAKRLKLEKEKEEKILEEDKKAEKLGDSLAEAFGPNRHFKLTTQCKICGQYIINRNFLAHIKSC
jgi:hypothetical protein